MRIFGRQPSGVPRERFAGSSIRKKILCRLDDVGRLFSPSLTLPEARDEAGIVNETINVPPDEV